MGAWGELEALPVVAGGRVDVRSRGEYGIATV